MDWNGMEWTGGESVTISTIRDCDNTVESRLNLRLPYTFRGVSRPSNVAARSGQTVDT